MRLLKFVLLVLFINSCKVYKKPAERPFITESDITIVCLDSLRSQDYLASVDYAISGLSRNVHARRDLNNEIDYVAIFNGVKQYHDIDILARITIDSLSESGVDTVLYFRDWPHTNGFNGYGKLTWKKSGIVMQKYIEFDSSLTPVNARFTSSQDSISSSALNYYLNTNINSDTCTPIVTKFIMSHIGSYFVYSKLRNTENCFQMSTVDVEYFNRHPKSNFIRQVRDLTF